ncbi:MAG TPA: PH domain-containing protein [Candidatus Limnocylindrales bacterium]|nr:PH domain-containing protein [Candidatus Limnocylindrales bacterium]
MNPRDNHQPANPESPSNQGHPSPSHQYQQTDQQPQLVFVSRPHEPIKPEMSPEVRQRHEDSKAKHPDLNLSEGEFIISAVKRHPIGLLQIWAVVGTILAILLGLFSLVVAGVVSFEGNGTLSPMLLAGIPLFLLALLVMLFGFVETIVYNGNRFYLTNESVIQQIQTSLFSKREQTVSLSNIEDASYTQHGFVQHMLDYGMIRLSTEGDETTYRFSFASNPKKQVASLNNAVEAFKNGRPVTGD